MAARQPAPRSTIQGAVSVDSAGNLYVPSSSRIREVTAATVPPSAVTAAPAFSVSAGTYSAPQRLTITDATPGASIYLTMDGTAPTTISPGYGGPIDVTGTVTIQAIAVAPGYLTSAPVSAAYTITSAPTAVITTVAGNGVSGFSGNGGPATSANVRSMQGVAADSAGNLYIADSGNNVVWMVSAKTGAISVVAGNGTSGYGGDGLAAVDAQLNQPAVVAVDTAGSLCIADSGNNVIRKVTASTGLISTFAGNYKAISQVGHDGDGGPATSAVLYSPSGLAFDGAGNLYIADSGDEVVRKVSATTGIITLFAGNYTNGTTGDGGPATSASLRQPNALAFDNAGNLYVADQAAGRVRKVAAQTGVITTAAGNGNVNGNSGDGGQATSSEISPYGIAVDAAGNLYISGWPGAVREVSAATGVITTMAGTGFAGYSGDGGSATVAELFDPQGIAFDAAGNLYIADSANFRARKVAFPGPAAMPTSSLPTGTYTGTQTVTITDSLQNATIYYTTDGSAPTMASSVYSSPITVAASETLQAIAVATGYTQSPVATAAYTIKQPIVPTITWPAPAAITYGTALSAAQLDASASVPGTFAYSPAAGTVLTAGTSEIARVKHPVKEGRPISRQFVSLL